jgi:catechol 2,3-dioxygenase-like lactoylglutathione lyase family enzyme
MQQRIDSGEVTRIYKPPSYYVNGIAEDLKYDPAALVAGADEKGKGQPAPKITAGSRAVKRRKQCDRVPEAAEFDITSVNHIAFIVSDVGKATDFCADVLGLQQVRRPDFDRHGAWFTGGNLEIHLILGNPLAPDRSIEGPDANSVSFKVEDLALAKDVLAKKYAADKSIMLEVESSACYVRDPDGYVFKIHE